MVWGPDGALYVGGIGNPGKVHTIRQTLVWITEIKISNGKPTFEMLAKEQKRRDGVEIES
ncbi:MAG: hypothetical protein IPP15_12670 [Saprospiraceae bacterium]|uniref:Uncharacterized protein n=1 Tax=Candidatus Opimibacter skivensis TaxID=2982028 RepID=A0A9D7SYP6_9BACT|nr:hypothetical protein [Candidatus Opimibacter skivensis]